MAREANAGRSSLHRRGSPTLRVTYDVKCHTQLSATKQRRPLSGTVKSLKGQFSYPPAPTHLLLGTQIEKDLWETAPGDTEKESKIKLKLAPAGVAEGRGSGRSFVCLLLSSGELTADRGRSPLGLLCSDRTAQDGEDKGRAAGTPPHPPQSLRLHTQSRSRC